MLLLKIVMTDKQEGLAQRTSQSKRQVGRSVSVNGVHALELEVNKSENLEDPILDVNLKLNNPVGRLWLALKRIWKSQNTIVALKFTIPLIVLPIAIYVAWRLWQGRGVAVPMSKLGLIHEVEIAGEPKDILVLPTSDVYVLKYAAEFEPSHRLLEKPVVVVGTYNHLSNALSVEEIIAYNESDIVPSPLTPHRTDSMWDTILRFIKQFK